MIDWLLAVVPLLKALHISALLFWCAGLIALPLMLSQYEPEISQDDYSKVRRSTHLTYTLGVTPAAVVTVIAGTWLMFLRETFVPWMFFKLVFVVVLVAAHVWLGHVLVTVAESATARRPPNPVLALAVVMIPIVAILLLVLGKPDLSGVVFPDWLTRPRGGQLPFEVPRR